MKRKKVGGGGGGGGRCEQRSEAFVKIHFFGGGGCEWRSETFVKIKKYTSKHWVALSSRIMHLFGIPIIKLRFSRWRRYKRQLPGGHSGD